MRLPAQMKRLAYIYLPLLLLSGLAFASCSDSQSATPPPTATSDGQLRNFEMGLSSLPPELTEESYEAAFELAGAAGDVILIQRTPPWAELLAGSLSDATERTTAREVELAETHGLDLFVAIDPMATVDGISALADLPEDYRGAGFDNEDIQQAFIDYARYVAREYRPRYLALGVEVNSYQHQQPEDFEVFVVVYHQAYEAVKEIAPETIVFPTFQLEELQGLLPGGDPYPQQWYLINRFEPRLDLLAVSSYPSLAFKTSGTIPPTYFAQIAAYTDRPVAITGMGFSSASDVEGEEDDAEREQADFLRRTLDNAQQLGMALVVWFAGQDPTFTGEPQRGLLSQIGLKRQDGSSKEAWQVWRKAARRPVTGDDGGEGD